MTTFLEHRPLLSSPCEPASFRPWISALGGTRVRHRLFCRAVRESFSCGQPFVSEALAIDGRDERIQPRKGMFFYVASVQAKGNLVHITGQMLGAYLMPCPVDAPLEQRPNALYGVRVDRAASILTFAMIDGAVIEPKAVQTRVALRLV